MGIVQTAQNSGADAGQNNIIVTFGANITPGNSVVVCLTGGDVNAANTTVTGGSDTFNEDVVDPLNAETSIRSVLSSVGGYSTITVHCIQTPSPQLIYAYEVSVLTAFDKGSTHDIASGTSSFTSNATATTTQANEVFFGIGHGSGVTDSSNIAGPASPWVNETSQFLSGQQIIAISGYNIVTSTQTATYSGTFPNSQATFADAAVATYKYTPTVLVSLPAARVTINAPAPQPPLFLPRAQITISALSPVITYSLSLPRAQINIAAAIQPRIALTLLAALAARAGTDDSGATFTQGFTGKTTAFQPGSNPLAFEAAHNMPAMAASWAVGAGGQAKYMFDSNGNLEFAFVLRTIGTKTDATVIWSAGSVPSGYRPPVAKYWPVTVIGTYVVSGNTPALLFGTDGSIAVYGISASTVTGIDAHGILPLNL